MLTISIVPVAILRLWNPPTSAFMLGAQLRAWRGDEDLNLSYRWQDLEAMSPWIALAVIAAEDQKFPRHRGFDVSAIQAAVSEHRAGRSLRGASTLTQQLAKNLFLWSGRSWLRKGLEAWFTVLLELCLDKSRILELYLNVAEFAPGIYGAASAADRFFELDAADLDPLESALMASALPNPRSYRLAQPDAVMRQRQAWILRQMSQLGGPTYLDSLE
jgi:monofunctional biosynthetic peptidoglycan transglycosylase